MLSGAQIKALGNRLREEDYTPEDLQCLAGYRTEFDPLLFVVNDSVMEAIRDSAITVAMAGRSKRLKSIVRKLRRIPSMDLSRMVDIVGLRIVVASITDQDAVVSAIQSAFCGRVKATKDSRGGGGLYRAVHVHVRPDENYRLVEVQVRTLSQQLWANESESFGEATKEGGGTAESQVYLVELSERCKAIDLGGSVPTVATASSFFRSRAPLSLRLPVLARLLAESGRQREQTLCSSKSFIIVFDQTLNRSHQRFEYEANERDEALQDYRQKCVELDEDRYETLILNSPSEAVIQVTHPRFFPEPD